MSKNKKLFLQTELSQIEVTNLLVDKLTSSIDYLAYNVNRYHLPVTLVLLYTEEEIEDKLKESSRLTDVIESIKIGNSYFNFVFLPFTDEVDSYTFIKHVESTKLLNIYHLYYYEKLPKKVHSHFNFLNNYLFEILEQTKAHTLI